MLKNGFEKIQEEMLKERAEALGRAGDSLSAALQKLREIEKRIDCELESFKNTFRSRLWDDAESGCLREEIVKKINREIDIYNRAREYAKLRYYYLIVIREAVGFRRHKQVEEIYKIPPQKKHLL